MSNPSTGGGQSSAVHAEGPLSQRYLATTLPVLAFITLVAFETIAVATAMPVAAADLGGVRSYGLAFSSFLTASLLGTVLAGSWADVRGPRAPMATGAVLFVLGQAVCAGAPVFWVLLVGRLLAGLGGGLVVVAIYVVVGAAYPDSLRPKVFGWISAAWVLPGIVGPAIAGWVADSVGWRWVFGAVVPFAVLVASIIVPRVSARTVAESAAGHGRVWRGLVLAGGAGGLQVGAQGLGRGNGWSIALTVAGVAGIAVALPGLLPRGTLRAARGLPSVVGVRGWFTAA
ncbi:MAG: MFS transporter, partial [Janthinobacterium lividum]